MRRRVPRSVEEVYHEHMRSIEDISSNNQDRKAHSSDGQPPETDNALKCDINYPMVEEFYIVDGNNMLLILIHLA